MAGYYDPNKDYSKAINEAKAAGKDTSQLEAERQNKIDDKYGGKEPTMYGSNKTYSQLSGSGSTWKDRDEISSAINIANTAQNNSIKQQMETEAQAGNWDKVGSLANGLAVPDGRYGGQDLTYVNQAWHDVAQKYGYNARDYYNQRYDEAYGDGSASVWDATNGAIKTISQWNELTGGAAIPSQTLAYGSNQAGGISGLEYGNGSDASQYIRDMYAQQQAAQLAALKSTYEQNVLDYQAQDDLISAEAQRQRNQAAAQNDLQRMYMNEMGIMQGLNTGTTGQMALAQSAAYLGDMAQIGAQEQQALSDSALERSKLKVQYSAAVDQAIAQNNYELANALYQEYVRQDTLAQQAAAAAQDQENWQAKFDYQKQQDAWANAAAQADILAGFGDFSGYKALGYSDAQIAMMQNAWNAKYGTPAVGTTGTTSASHAKGRTVGYNNGGLTSDQVKALQNYYGVTVDGAWGKNSTSAAYGMTASQAWEQFTAPVTDVSQLYANGIAVANSLARGYTTGTQQRDAIISAYQNGRITRGEAEFLARAVGASL